MNHRSSGVKIEMIGRLNGERLDLAVGQRGEVTLLAGHPLNVDGREVLVGEDDEVAPGGLCPPGGWIPPVGSLQLVL